MTNSKPTISLDTVLDWAYCEARVWWQMVGRNIDSRADMLIRPRTGEQLLKEAVMGTLKLGLDSYVDGQVYKLPELLGTLWKVRLKKWGLSHLRENLAAYSALFEVLLSRFNESGDIKRPDGTLYVNPVWSHRWRDLVTSMGLADLRILIESEQHKAGLGKRTKSSKIDMWREPIGLADSFARSAWIINNNSFSISDIVGVGEKAVISLPHIQIEVAPDLAMDSDGALIYMIFLYDIKMPSMKELLTNYTIKALSSAQYKDGREPSSVFVRHLISGKTIHIKPRRSAGLIEIAPMAEAVHRRISAQDYSGPRMVNGWKACGDCDYKPLCFNGDGLIQQYNLSLSGKISLANELLGEIRSNLSDFSEEEKRIGMSFARVFLPWVTQNPGMSADQIEWLLSGD